MYQRVLNNLQCRSLENIKNSCFTRKHPGRSPGLKVIWEALHQGKFSRNFF